jgi:hypothetical protein
VLLNPYICYILLARLLLLLLLLLGIALFDITPQIRQRVQQLGVTEGFVNVLSRHTTTAVAINEYETRLLDDIRQVGGSSSGMHVSERT